MSHSDAALHRSLARADRTDARGPATRSRSARAGAKPRVSGKDALRRLSGKRERHPASPFTDARRAYNERFGFHLDAAATWRKWSVMAGLLALGCAILLVATLTSQRVVPWVVYVDRQGQAQLLGPAHQVSLADDAVMRPLVVRFVLDTRRLRYAPADPAPLAASLRSFVMPGSNAADAITQAAATVPAEQRRAMPGVVFSSVSARRTSGTEWLVTWDESIGDPSTAVAKTKRRARVNAQLAPPESDPPDAANPLGLRVQSIAVELVVVPEAKNAR
jgi:type IV secretion system protein TrbF